MDLHAKADLHNELSANLRPMLTDADISNMLALAHSESQVGKNTATMVKWLVCKSGVCLYLLEQMLSYKAVGCICGILEHLAFFKGFFYVRSLKLKSMMIWQPYFKTLLLKIDLSSFYGIYFPCSHNLKKRNSIHRNFSCLRMRLHHYFKSDENSYWTILLTWTP